MLPVHGVAYDGMPVTPIPPSVKIEQKSLALYRSRARKQLLAKHPGPNSLCLYVAVEVCKATGDTSIREVERNWFPKSRSQYASEKFASKKKGPRLAGDRRNKTNGLIL